MFLNFCLLSPCSQFVHFPFLLLFPRLFNSFVLALFLSSLPNFFGPLLFLLLLFCCFFFYFFCFLFLCPPVFLLSLSFLTVLLLTMFLGSTICKPVSSYLCLLIQPIVFFVCVSKYVLSNKGSIRSWKLKHTVKDERFHCSVFELR